MLLFKLVSALSSLSLAAAWTTYVVPHSPGKDDTLALTAAFSANPSLARDTTILFKKGVTYNISTPLTFPMFTNVLVSIQGNISYAADIKATQAIVQSLGSPVYWFTFSGGSNVTLEGSQDPSGGWINANGQKWWDSMQKVSSQVNRPSGWCFCGIQGGEMRYMKLRKPVAWSFSTSASNNLYIHNNKILAVSSTSSIPYNTDGFGASGTNLLFDNNVVFNGDDCVTINSPANNVTYRNGYCYGSHGLSVIGSSGQDVTDIKNILFENVVMESCSYAARFKSCAGGKGTAKNIIWKGITLKKVQLPIFVTQTYWDQDNGAEPDSSSEQTSTNIDTLTFQNFQGTIYDKGNGVTGSTGKEVVIFDVFQGAAQSLLAKNISTTTLSGSHVTVMCDPSKISGDVGFKCWDGLYQPTLAGE